MERFEFDAEILQPDEKDGGAYILFPYDVVQCFGKKNLIPITCAFDGIPYRGVIANMGAGPCIGLLKSIRKQLGKGRGDSVRVVVAQDTQERVLEVPEQLALELEKNAEARAYFEQLSYTRKKEYCAFIADAKKEETRRSRLEKAMSRLINKQFLK